MQNWLGSEYFVTIQILKVLLAAVEVKLNVCNVESGGDNEVSCVHRKMAIAPPWS